MNAIVPAQFGPLADIFKGSATPNANDTLSAGIEGGFGIVGYRGKTWSIRYRGNDIPLMRDDGDGPRNSIEVVIVSASNSIAKIFYEQGYVEGSDSPPECYSTNGVVPHPGATKKQSLTCALCPKNAWGSRTTPAGKQAKACSDSRRVTVVPLADIQNEMFGGPLLLRIPAASLNELAQFGAKMGAIGYPYFAIGTRIAFDVNESFPKFIFTAIRPLTPAEGQIVMAMREQPLVARILAEGNEPAQIAPPAATPAQLFEQPPANAQPVAVQPAPAPAPVTPAVTVAPTPAPAPAPAPAPKPVISAGGFGATVVAANPAGAAPAPQPVQAMVLPAAAPPTAPADEDAIMAEMDRKLEELLPAAK